MQAQEPFTTSKDTKKAPWRTNGAFRHAE